MGWQRHPGRRQKVAKEQELAYIFWSLSFPQSHRATHLARCAQDSQEGIRPALNRASLSAGHSPPSHSRSSTAASSKEHKPVRFSKGLYFTGQSSSKLQQLEALAPWEAAMQPSGLRSGQPGYSSPDPLTGAAEMRAHRGAGCHAPPPRSPRPGDASVLHTALHGRCWRGEWWRCCQAGRPCGCSAALARPAARRLLA